MLPSPSNCFQLPAVSVSELIAQPVGKLKPLLAEESDITQYTALDCFDHPLRHTGRMLLSTQNTLELFDPCGQTLIQAAKSRPDFITDIAKGPLAQALADVSPLRRLQALGSGQRQHAVLTLVDDEEKTHCRAHLLLLTNNTGQAIALATLQAIRGYDASLQALRERLIELGGMAANGANLYDPLFSLPSLYNAKPDVAITSDTSAFDAANSIIATHIPIARANEPGIIADIDTEFLHDYRILLRKVRSVVSLFQGVYTETQTQDLKNRFSAIMAPTGPLRDLDVYLLDKQAYYKLLPKHLHAGLDRLFGMLSGHRQAEQLKLSQYLSSKAYKQEITALSALFARPGALAQGPDAQLPAHDYACKLIWRRYRKVCKTAASIDAQTPDEQVHDLRIQCKKLRYLMEFFGAIFPATAFKTLLKSLKGLQDNLGRFNDYSVQQTNLQTMLQTLPEGQTESYLEVAQSIGALLAMLHGRQLKERAKIMNSFARFNSPETQQLFRELFQAKKA